MKLYRQIAIWKKVGDDEAIRYNLIEDLAERRFAHQSADFFRPSSSDEEILFLEKLFGTLMTHDLDQRSWFDSIEEAIEDFDRPSPDMDEIVSQHSMRF